MIDALASIILSAESGHLPIELQPVERARILYRDRTEIGASTISSHGWRIAPGGGTPVGSAAPPGAPYIGLADRYGGNGIGLNGGSGRNAIIGAVQVKGIGRTPLVDPAAPLSHASGGAYLEECIREAIFAGIVAHDFPYGAIPTMEILDTGETEHWPAPIDPALERRVLLVRPLFIRPAHFERAVGFDLPGTFEGMRDQTRVHLIWTRAAALLGAPELVRLFDECWHRWAHQLAYGFIHRLSHGNNTSSNISIDGRLLDFGAASTVPSWANTATSHLHDPINRRFNAIAQGMRSVSYYFGANVGWEWARPNVVEAALRKCAEAFRRALVFEALRLCGLTDRISLNVITGPRRDQAFAAVAEAISSAQMDRSDLLEPLPLPQTEWPMARIWTRERPPPLDALRRLLDSLVGRGMRDECELTHRRRCVTRTALFKPHLRQHLFTLIDGDLDARLRSDPGLVQGLVEDHVRCNVLEAGPASGDAMRLRLPMAAA